MKVFLAVCVAAVAVSAPASAATQITVDDIGVVLNQSLALPAQDTPGSGIGFAEFFEFTLPTRETVTLSVSDSAILNRRIVGGELSLNNFASSAPTSPFQPLGSLIESSALANVVGGQEATVTPDPLSAGAYFAEVSGISGGSPIHIAIDGTVTAVSTPEPSAWAMSLIGFGFLAMFGFQKRRHHSFGV